MFLASEEVRPVSPPRRGFGMVINPRAHALLESAKRRALRRAMRVSDKTGFNFRSEVILKSVDTLFFQYFLLRIL